MTEGVSEVSRPTVVLVDDHRMFRSGVRTELGELVDVVARQRMSTQPWPPCCEQPDVVLLDVHLPGGNGPEVIQRVGARRPDDDVSGAVSVGCG